MRAVRCVLGDYGETVDDRECNAAARPRDNQVGIKRTFKRDQEIQQSPHSAEFTSMHFIEKMHLVTFVKRYLVPQLYSVLLH